MAVNLHDRLSEFSYGYGVTREVETSLQSIGLRVTPFLPSLLDEGSLGYDARFDRPGRPLLLQFKLGEELRRFRRADPLAAIPAPLARPFWRFKIDISAPQFMLLEQAQSQAEVYYIAPRFSDWTDFDDAFQASQVLDRSLMVTPADIRNAIQAQRAVHRVVYDLNEVYVCSDPKLIPETKPGKLVEDISTKIRANRQPLKSSVDALFNSRGEVEGSAARLARRADQLRIMTKKRSEEEVKAAALGIEAWAHGAQLILVADETIEPA